MEVYRAQEIADSRSMVNVTYNGTPVYIEHVDQNNGKATIHPLDEPTNKQSVSVTDLSER
jgi:small acid-soluble spore protein H (minor)